MQKKKKNYQPQFKSITGIVKEIRKSETDKNTTYVLIDSKDVGEAYLLLTKDTYFINNEEIRLKSEVTGYYDANAMMIIIYPPQYEAVAIQVSNQEQNLKVDLFDANLTSADHMLKLNISKDTLVVTKDGKVFNGELANRKLAVFYRTSTKVCHKPHQVKSLLSQTLSYRTMITNPIMLPLPEL